MSSISAAESGISSFNFLYLLSIFIIDFYRKIIELCKNN